MEKKTYLILKRTSTILIRTFCFLVFIFQFYLLTCDYKQFNVRKEVINYIEDEIELPEIHIAIPYQYTFDHEFLSKYKVSFNQVCRKSSDKINCNDLITNVVLFSKWLGHSLKLSDVIKYSYSTETFIKGIRWAETSEDPLETGKCQIVRKASSGSLVLIIRCLGSNGLPLRVSRAKAVVFNSNYLFGFNLNASVMLLKLIYPGKALVEDSSSHSFAATEVGKGLSLGFRFTKHTENSLPPPYKTMCKNYDRRQTFEDCLNSKAINRTKMLFPGTSISLNEYNHSTELRFNSPFDVNSDLILEIYRNCQSLVAEQMCNNVRFSFSMSMNSFQQDKQDRKEMRLFFVATSETDSITQSKAEFPLSDYLILSGSLFGTWFGISIMGQLLAASHLFFIPYDRKSTNVVTNQSDETTTNSNNVSND